MQRLLVRKLASSLGNASTTAPYSSSSASLFHSLPYNTFSSVTKPSLLNQLLPKNPLHRRIPLQLRSQETLVRGFLSNPVAANGLLMKFRNKNIRILGKNLTDCKVWFLQRSRGSGQSFITYNRSWRTWFRQLGTSNMVLGLIIANVGVFMLWRIADQQFMMKNFTISVDNFKSGRLHTLITSAFSHADASHIISNMVGLYFFGMNIGNTFGPEYILRLYLAGAIVGSVFFLVYHEYLALTSKGGLRKDPWKTPGLGASGAVNAIMLLDIFLNPTATLYLDFIIPVPAMLVGVFLISKDMLGVMKGDSHISWATHLGGAVVAAIAWARVKRGRF